MHYSYLVHGILVGSDESLIGVESLPYNAVPSLQIYFYNSPPSEESNEERYPFFSDPLLTQDGIPVLEAVREPSSYRLRYYDGTEFLLSDTGTEVWVLSLGPGFESACAYLLGPVLGFVLRLRGTLCLHATVIGLGESAFAIMGPSGAGKSTLAATFAKAGFPVLSDDVVAISESADKVFLATPSNLRSKLWPDSVAAIYGDIELPRLDPECEKRVVNLCPVEFTCASLVLRAVFILQERSTDTRAPYVEKMAPAAAMVALASHTYANYLLTPEMRKHEFGALQRLVDSAFVCSVTPQDGFSKLPILRDFLCAEFHKLVAED